MTSNPLPPPRERGTDPDIADSAPDAPRLDRSLETLSRHATALARRAPRWGWLLARLGYGVAIRSGRPTLLAEATLTLGVTTSLRERFDPAIRLLERAEALFAQQQDRAGVARCHWQRGVALRFQAQLSPATDQLEGALAEFQALGLPSEVARVQRDLAIAFNLLDAFDRAEALITPARGVFEEIGQTVEVARCDLVIGSRLRQRTRYRQSIEVLQSARRTFEAEGEIIEAAKARYLIGLARIQLQDYPAARSDLEAAERTFQSAGLPLRLAYVNMDLGRVLWRLGDLDSARAHMEAALEWSEAHHIPTQIADCSLNLGNLLYVEGDYVGAEARYERALRIYRQLEIRRVTARCEQNLALVHRWQGDLSKALDRLHRAAQALEAEGIAVWAADCHFKMAEIYLGLHQLETAALHVERARTGYEQEGVPLSQAWCDILDAQIATLAGDPGGAIRTLEQARQSIASTGSRWHTALCDRLLADAFLEQGQVDAAGERYEMAQRRFEVLGAQVDIAACRLGLGRVYRRMGQLARAERTLGAALEVTAGALPEWSGQLYAELGEIAQARGRERRALQRFRQAVEALRLVRLALPTASLAGSLAASQRSIYDRALELALDLEESGQALELVEETSALALMGRLHAHPAQDVDDAYRKDLMTREVNLRSAIAQTRRALLRAYDRPSNSTEASRVDAPTLLKDLRRRRSEHLRLLQQLSASGHVHFDAVEPFLWPRFRDTMEEHLPAEWSALITHWVDDEELLVFHADPDGVEVHRHRLNPLERSALEMATATAPERRTLVYQGRMFGASTGSQLGETARRTLYQVLIPPPISDRLAPDQLLIVVPDGPLHHLPFPALESDAGFLAQQAVVSLAPSLGVLERLLRRRSRRPVGGRTLLIGLGSFDQAQSDLDWTLPEVDLLGSIYGDAADCLRDADATRERIQAWNREARLSRYGILHFATHGRLDAASGALSGLSLWEADLVSADIERLRLGSPLVVLSACQSGLGKIHPGDEVTGLPQAFLSAGAQTVMTSLWHIDDRSTMALMEAYHRRVRAGVPAARALAEVQRQAIRQGHSPYTWGAFVSVGVPGWHRLPVDHPPGLPS